MPFVPYVGALGASAWVVAYNASATTKRTAAALRDAGYPVWLCDGVADQVEIQAALNGLPSQGGLVQLSEGQFFQSASLSWAGDGWWLNGLGNPGNPNAPGGTRLVLDPGSDCDMIVFSPAGYIYGSRISNLGLLGNKTSQASGHGIAVYRNVRSLTLEHLLIWQIKGDGIHIEPVASLGRLCQDWYWAHIGIWVADGCGLRVVNAPGFWVGDGIIVDLRVENPGEQGVNIQEVGDVSFVGLRVADAIKDGIVLKSSSDIQINDGRIYHFDRGNSGTYDGIRLENSPEAQLSSIVLAAESYNARYGLYVTGSTWGGGGRGITFKGDLFTGGRYVNDAVPADPNSPFRLTHSGYG